MKNMTRTPKAKTTLVAISLSCVVTPCLAQQNLTQYLEQQSNNLSQEDHYSAPVAENLDLDAKADTIVWKDDQTPRDCQYAKGEATEAKDYDYGVANNLSDGLHNIDLQPVHTPKKLRKDHIYNTASSSSSVKFSVSSDCL